MSNFKQHFLKMLRAAQQQQGQIKLQPLRQRQKLESEGRVWGVCYTRENVGAIPSK